MDSIKIELSEAVNIALHTQLYRFLKHKGQNGLLSMINELGYIQIDTVSVIERAHHHTIWSRMKEYESSWLDTMLRKDKSIFEFWGHAASYLPINDYRYFLPRMKNFPDTSPWAKEFWMKHHSLGDAILERIRNEGPLSASDFEDTRIGTKQQGWWDWKPAKVVLELLMWKGDLMVSERRNFQRIYDLTERVLPSWIDTSMPTAYELGRFYVMRALRSQGISTEWDIVNHMQTKETSNIKKTLKEMVNNGEVIPVSIEGSEQIYYSTPGFVNNAGNDIRHPNNLFLLSPFDNVTILRPRLKRLFNFDYTIECYVPAAKRVYGYWCLPMLWKGSFIGRIDMKADRQNRILIIRNLHLETECRISASLAHSLRKSLYNFMEFNQCDNIQWDTEEPLKLISLIKESD